MSQATNTKLMDTEPGGENTQYESQNTFMQSHAKQSGQFADPSTNEATLQAEQQKNERGEKTAENIRYGEAISEHGFGGETLANSGGANQGSRFGGVKEDEGSEGGQQTRREQGYGGGNGVGA